MYLIYIYHITLYYTHINTMYIIIYIYMTPRKNKSSNPNHVTNVEAPHLGNSVICRASSARNSTSSLQRHSVKRAPRKNGFRQVGMKKNLGFAVFFLNVGRINNVKMM